MSWLDRSLHAFHLANLSPILLSQEKCHLTFSNAHANYALNLCELNCSLFSSLSHKSPFNFFFWLVEPFFVVIIDIIHIANCHTQFIQFTTLDV